MSNEQLKFWITCPNCKQAFGVEPRSILQYLNRVMDAKAGGESREKAGGNPNDGPQPNTDRPPMPPTPQARKRPTGSTGRAATASGSGRARGSATPGKGGRKPSFLSRSVRALFCSFFFRPHTSPRPAPDSASGGKRLRNRARLLPPRRCGRGSGGAGTPSKGARGSRGLARLPSFSSLPATSRRQGRSAPPLAGELHV